MREVNQLSDEEVGRADRSWLGWMARILSVILGVIWLSAAALFALNGSWTETSVVLAGLIFMSITDMALAWWRADIGGVVLLTTALVHGLFAYFTTSSDDRGLTIAIRAGPFLIVGLLFIAAWQYSGRKTGV